jgi:hypothetical protein
MKEIQFKNLSEGQKFIIGKATFVKGRGHGGVQGGWSGANWRFIDGEKKVKVRSESIL